MFKRQLMNSVCWAPNDGAGGGSGGAGGGAGGGALAAAAEKAAGGDQGTQGGQGGQQGQQSQDWAAPEGFPEEFKGKDAGESLSKLLGGYQDLNKKYTGAREAIAKMPAAPKSADEYQFVPSEKVKAYFPEGKPNPIMDLAREAAFKNGVPATAYAPFINSLYEAAIDKGVLAPPFDERAEINTFKTALGLDDKGAAQGLKDMVGFAEGLSKQLTDVPQAQKADVEAALMALTDTAAGNLLLRSIQQRLNTAGIRIAGEGALASGALTKEDLKTMSADPRIDPANRHHADPDKRYDENLRKRYDDAYKTLYAAG